MRRLAVSSVRLVSGCNPNRYNFDDMGNQFADDSFDLRTPTIGGGQAMLFLLVE